MTLNKVKWMGFRINWSSECLSHRRSQGMLALEPWKLGWAGLNDTCPPEATWWPDTALQNACQTIPGCFYSFKMHSGHFYWFFHATPCDLLAKLPSFFFFKFFSKVTIIFKVRQKQVFVQKGIRWESNEKKIWGAHWVFITGKGFLQSQHVAFSCRGPWA